VIKPVRNNVLVKPFLKDETSKGGIIVPNSFRGESEKVLIVAVGEGTKKMPMKLKVGEIGFRVKEWGVPVIENGEQFYIMEQSSILATV
jgi:co-chaperonin GroES (HSP10)